MCTVDHGGNVSAQIAYATRTDRPTDRWIYDAWYYNVTQHITIPGGKTVELETLLFDSVIGLGNSDKILEDGTVIELKGDELPGPDDPPTAEAQWKWLEGRMNSSTADYLWVGTQTHVDARRRMHTTRSYMYLLSYLPLFCCLRASLYYRGALSSLVGCIARPNSWPGRTSSTNAAPAPGTLLQRPRPRS
jgi:hypothetical protein